MTAPLAPTTDRVISPRLSETLRKEAERRLRRSGYLALRDVSCAVQSGRVRLGGRLPTYYLKQIAQTLVAEIDGVRQVINQIDVIAPAGRSPLGSETSRGATGSNSIERKPESREGSIPSAHPEGGWERCWS